MLRTIKVVSMRLCQEEVLLYQLVYQQWVRELQPIVLAETVADCREL